MHLSFSASSPAYSWVLLAVCSAIFLGVYDVAKKASVRDNAVLVVLFASSATGLALMLPLGALSLAAAATHGMVRFETLAGRYHEIFNDTGREEVVSLLVAWLDAVLVV